MVVNCGINTKFKKVCKCNARHNGIGQMPSSQLALSLYQMLHADSINKVKRAFFRHDRRTATKFGTHVRIYTGLALLTLNKLTHPTPGGFSWLSKLCVAMMMFVVGCVCVSYASLTYFATSLFARWHHSSLIVPHKQCGNTVTVKCSSHGKSVQAPIRL